MGETGLRNPDWGIPVIYTRAPDGKLFDLPQAAPTITHGNTAIAPQTSGVNISLGDHNEVAATTVKVDNVGNNITSGTLNTNQKAKDDENAAQIAYLQDMIHQKKRRLQQLKLQAARYGISTPPEITTEIEDLEGYKDYRGNLLRPGEIAKLEQDLRAVDG
jgi:hypothetical protein